MAEHPEKPVLLTGASGALGRVLTAALAAEGWNLRLTDISPFPDPVPSGCSFTQADLNDGPAIAALAAGCGMILHFGGISTEHPFEEILGPNLRGMFHIYEAAKTAGARVLFASSNHSIGFHERNTILDQACQFMPDGFYGLSKAYGELMGRLYWFKHGVENVNLRIGSAFPQPVTARMLSTWLSYADLTRLCIRATMAEAVGSCVIWGASNNTASFWAQDDRAKLGWMPQDSADAYAADLEGKVSADPIEEKFQGGGFTSDGYSRKGPPPPPLFA